VDHIGSVVLSEEEWRQAPLKEVIQVTSGTAVKNSMIPLFRTRDTLFRMLEYYGPHYIHFCDCLTDVSGRKVDLSSLIGLQQELRERFPETGIIRTIPVPKSGSANHFPALEIARQLEPYSDLFLIDTCLGKEPVDGFIGITGENADREMSKTLVSESAIPVILAGGLSPENVYEAVMGIMPAGADSCTRTNRVNGDGNPVRFKKDFEKVRRFVEEVRRADSDIRSKIGQLKGRYETLKEELRERELALPVHSVRPHQLTAIETLEDEIVETEKALNRRGKSMG